MHKRCGNPFKCDNKTIKMNDKDKKAAVTVRYMKNLHAGALVLP